MNMPSTNQPLRPSGRRGRLSCLLVALLLAACDSETAAPPPPAAKAQAATTQAPYPPRPPEIADTSLLGANPPPVADNSRTHVYVDLMHQARRFGTPETPWDEKALIGDDGWPIGDFGVFLMTRQAGLTGIPGTYTVTFQGRAEVKAVASKATVKPARHDASTNRTTVEVLLPEDADQLTLAFTQTGQGIRDLKVIRPGYPADNPPLFTRPFLQHIERFQTLRFMDWLRTNNNPVQRWSQRSTPETTHFASPKGVPWEHIIALANQTGKDIWINIPAGADDDYVTQLAKLLRSQLNERSRIYVEYSNEVWNGMFKQHGHNFDQAEAEVRDNPASVLAHDGKRDRATLGYRRIAKRGKEISDIFRQVFGDAAMMQRVRPVYSIQVVNTYATEIGLNFLSAVYGPPDRYFYALAGAPYFNLGEEQTNVGLSTDQVLAAMDKSINRLAETNRLEKNHALAAWHGLPFIAYEGGSDTFGPGSLDSKKAANLDPRMEAVCRRYLASWYQMGGGLFMWFNAGAGNWDTQYGAWELTTDLALSDTPKIRCMDHTLAAGQPTPQGRNTVPGQFEALAYAGNFAPYSDGSKTTIRHLRPGHTLDYRILARTKGKYALRLHAASDKPGNQLDIGLDGQDVHQALELQPRGWEQPVWSAPVQLNLSAGFHTLRLTTRQASSGFDLRHLDLQLIEP